MNCRYCGNVYTSEDRACAGCGAPKNALRQTLLDAPATPEHWTNSFGKTTKRVLIATVLVIVLLAVLDWAGIGELGGVVAFFWALPVAPFMLTYAAWREAKGEWLKLLPYMFFIPVVTMGVMMTVLFAIGMTYADEDIASSVPALKAPNAPLDPDIMRK